MALDDSIKAIVLKARMSELDKTGVGLGCRLNNKEH